MRLWKSYPPDFIAEQVIVPGGAFRARVQFRDEGMKERYLFVLNKSPQSDDDLVIATATTQIDRRIRHRGSNVVVVVL